jgi:DNA invertase Pin-like site-specific DNA recombinase
LGIFGSVEQWERELISNSTKSGLKELDKTRKLGTPSNLNSVAKRKGVESIIRNRIENEKWKLRKTFIEQFQMKKGYTSLTEISKRLNLNSYRIRRGCSFSPEIVKRLIGS